MDEQLQRWLRKRGVVKGLRNLQSRETPTVSPTSTKHEEAPLPGEVVKTAHGPAWVARHTYPPDQQHGAYRLGKPTTLAEDVLALLSDEDLALGPRPALLDTETTGLAGGAGTLVFLTGVGIWTEAGVELHQVFMRDPGEEAATMAYLDALLADATALVTFNGRTFDLPLLETRFMLQRRQVRWDTLPHLDLLTVARRLWRDHFPSRSLSYLEEAVLDVHRSGDDMPGWMIPTAYRRYLQTGTTREIRRIFYHNEIDVLSMVTLLRHTALLVEAPQRLGPAAAEWVGLGHLYAAAGQREQAEAAWWRALDTEKLPEDLAARLWRELGLHPKRAERWEAALEIWRRWARRQPHAVEPLVEQAKYFEWQALDLGKALEATQRALGRLEKWPQGRKRRRELAALRHRQERLLRKIDAAEQR
ncbi:MAG: ribonuclease H-like domain-containing protein [Anaerolineae bacterium]